MQYVISFDSLVILPKAQNAPIRHQGTMTLDEKSGAILSNDPAPALSLLAVNDTGTITLSHPQSNHSGYNYAKSPKSLKRQRILPKVNVPAKVSQRQPASTGKVSEQQPTTQDRHANRP